MKLKEMSKEELENMSYDDLAYLILEEHGKKMKLLDIFKKVAKYANISEDEIENKITDFFELLSTDKKFVILDKGYWDLSSKHMKHVIIEDEEDSIEDVHDEFDDLEAEKEEEDIFYDKDDDATDDTDDDLSDLVIIDPEDDETSV